MKLSLEQRLRRIEEKVSQKKSLKESVSYWKFKSDFIALLSSYLQKAASEFGEDSDEYNEFESKMRDVVVSTFNSAIVGYQQDLTIN